MTRRNASGHTRFRRGKRLRVKLVDGEVFEDWYVGDANGYVVLRRRGRVAASEVSSMSILKGRIDG